MLILFFIFAPNIIENNRVKVTITNQLDFVDHLNDKKIRIDKENLSIENIKLPERINDEYDKYCNFLKGCGYNLKLYLGDEAKIFIGNIIDSGGEVLDKEIHVITVKDKVVGENIVNLKTQEYEKIK